MTEVKLQAHPRAKVVCVGRNYAEHARELGNPVPDEPLLFIKPSTAVAPFDGAYRLPPREPLHFELELALLVGEGITADDASPMTKIAGVGLGLDLTRRQLQSELKAAGKPWERAKAFDHSCLLGPFVPMTAVSWPLRFSLQRNDCLQQQGDTRDMLFPPETLLAAIARDFSLLPGDVVLTGTPAGVGALKPGDVLSAEIEGLPATAAHLQCLSGMQR